MDTKELLEQYSEIRECDYRGEHYSVRDNGAIFRHQRVDMPKRPKDNKWTFGIKNDKGYMVFCKERVHRIVCLAFNGEPEEEDFVVDHIDTNRCNNRPDNLRWLSKLDNVLKNPITYRRICDACGTIEAFLENPTMLKDYGHLDPNFLWMRTVTKEEASNSFNRLMAYANSEKKDNVKAGNGIGEWIFEEPKKVIKKGPASIPSYVISDDEFFKSFEPTGEPVAPEPIPQFSEEEKQRRLMEYCKSHLSGIQEPVVEKKTICLEGDDIAYESLTPGVYQDWKTPTEFLLCPEEVTLESYLNNLEKGKIMSRNQYGEQVIKGFEVNKKDNSIIVKTMYTNEGQVKPYLISKIIIRENKFVHRNLHSFFEENGQDEFFEGYMGRKWKGEHSSDYYSL